MNNMSFDKFKETAENGDTVILYLGFNNMHTIVLKSGNVFQTRYGALKHSDVIGSPYGSRVQCAKGYVYVLYPTPELWTVNLPHRTQILYSTDIAMVTMQLDLKPGAVVVESGMYTGVTNYRCTYCLRQSIKQTIVQKSINNVLFNCLFIPSMKTNDICFKTKI